MIPSFQHCIRCPNSSRGLVGDVFSLSLVFSMVRFISCSHPSSSRITVSSSLSTQGTMLQAPIFQFALEHGSLMSSHCQLSCFELSLPYFHLVLLPLDAITSLSQSIPLFLFLLLFFSFFLFLQLLYFSICALPTHQSFACRCAALGIWAATCPH